MVSVWANTPEAAQRTSVAGKIIPRNIVDHPIVAQSLPPSIVVNDSNPEAELHSRNRLYAECFLAGRCHRYANALVAAWQQERSRSTRLPSPETGNRFRTAPCQRSAGESHRH